jgi:hydroxyacylglutathione hydrolase
MTNETNPLNVRAVRAFADNYIWLIAAPARPGAVVAVDPGDADPVRAELQRAGLSLAAIFLTHHHADHIGGVAALLAHAAVPVIGPDDDRIALKTRAVQGGDRVALDDLGLAFEVLAVPGHTSSHVAFWGHDALFCGDTLFSAGCGRLFEGTPLQMRRSLQRLAALPGSTRMYCGHEYTAANLRFALAVDPDNVAARAYRDAVALRRAADEPSLPSTVELERAVNPFLRCSNAAVRAAAERHAGQPLGDETEVFAELRGWKDGFRA